MATGKIIGLFVLAFVLAIWLYLVIPQDGRYPVAEWLAGVMHPEWNRKHEQRRDMSIGGEWTFCRAQIMNEARERGLRNFASTIGNRAVEIATSRGQSCMDAKRYARIAMRAAEEEVYRITAQYARR